MKALVACEFSGIIRDALLKQGVDAYSCDIISCEKDNTKHIKDDVLNHLDNNWDLLIAHPPCTYLANSGSRHFYAYQTTTKITGAQRVEESEKAIKFFNVLKNANIKFIAIENPIPHKWARAEIGNYSQIVQPFMFGHPYTKQTCLWLKNLPLLKPSNLLDKRNLKSFAHTEVRKQKDRSRTFIGLADAMALQWVPFILAN